MNNNIIKNFKYAFFSQLLAVVSSIVIGFILPRFISVEEYGYWQLFMLYCICMELTLLGIPNGIYLIYAGRLKEDSRQFLKYSFVVVFCISLCIAIIFGVGFTYFSENIIVYRWLAVAVLIINIGTFFGYLTQTINDIRCFAFSNFTLFFILTIGFSIAIFIECKSVISYIAIFIFAHIIRTSILVWRNKEILKCQLVVDNFFTKLVGTSKVGLKILFIDYTNILTLGCFRLMIKQFLGIIAFSKMSLALSMVLFGISFINQVITTLLSSFRELDKNNLKQSYLSLRNKIPIFLLLFLVSYRIVAYGVETWLPAYNNSIIFIMLLYPLVVSEGKMQIIYCLFLKVLRKEKLLLYINIVYCVLCVLGCYVILNFLKNQELAILVIVVISTIKSLITEMKLATVIGIGKVDYKKIFIEIFAVLLFLILNFINTTNYIWYMYCAALIVGVYFVYLKNDEFSKIKTIYLK